MTTCESLNEIHSWLPKKLKPEQTLFFNVVFYRMHSGMQFYSNLGRAHVAMSNLLWHATKATIPTISEHHICSEHVMDW